MLRLTSDNYFSAQAEKEYMSASQFRRFWRCEAAALAGIEGRYAYPRTTAMLVGSYVDAYFEGALDAFKRSHAELFRQNGALRAEYAHADRLIARLERDELYMLLMSGKKQVVMTGEIAGVPYKIKIDSLLDGRTCQKIAQRFPKARAALGFCDGAIVDQKIMASLADVWSDEEWGRVPFVRAWGYDTQGAIYQAIEGHMLPFILAVGTKEEAPGLAALYIPDQELAAKLETVKNLSPRYQAIKQHRLEPVGCGKCPYCRSLKKLDAIVDFREWGADENDEPYDFAGSADH